MKNTKIMALMVFPLIYGCGGGAEENNLVDELISSNKRYFSTRKNGYYINGLPYICGKNKGFTGNYGEFEIDKDKECSFFIGKNEYSIPYKDLLKSEYIFVDNFPLEEKEVYSLVAAIKLISHESKLDPKLLEIDPMLVGRVDKFTDLNTSTIQYSLNKTFNSTLGVLDQNYGYKIVNDKKIKNFTPSIKYFKQHDNRVNFYVYDTDGNPLTLSSVYNPGITPDVWVTEGQNPHGSLPSVSTSAGDKSGQNVFGMDLQVGRKTSTQAADSYNNNLKISTNVFSSPVTVYATQAASDEESNSYYPQSLNFGYRISFTVNAANGYNYQCNNIMLGQGSKKASLKTILDFTKELVETAYETSEMISEEGDNVKQDVKTVKSYSNLAKAASDLATENWWLIGQDNSYETYRISVWNNKPAVLVQCYANGQSVPGLLFGSVDDHTFSLQLGSPGKPLLIKGESNYYGS